MSGVQTAKDGLVGEEGDETKPAKEEQRRGAGDMQRPLHALGFKTTTYSPMQNRTEGDDGEIRTAREMLTESNKRVEHTSDDSIVYLVGKQVGVYSYETQAHRFMPLSQRTQEVVCFAVSFNKRYIALSERVLEDRTNEMSAQISVYNFGTVSRIRTLSLSFLNKSSPVTSMDFSRDNKYLIAVTQGIEPFINLWQLDKSRLLAFTELNVKISDITISPWVHFSMCSTAPEGLRLWRYQERQIRCVDPIPKKVAQDFGWVFTAHCWFDEDHVCVGTLQGDLLVVDNCEIKRVIPSIFAHMGTKLGLEEGDVLRYLSTRQQNTGEGQGDAGGGGGGGGGDDDGQGRADGNVPSYYQVLSLRATGRGVAVGGDHGILGLFERTYDHDYFQRYKVFCTPHSEKITDISVSPNEEVLICCHADNELAQFSLASVDILDHERPDEISQACRLLPIGFHNDTVTAVDVCVQKSVIVTASADRRVRIWNFVKKRVEIRKEFSEAALSVSIHPSGAWLLIGFKYKLAMFSVLMDGLHLCQEFPIKQCREVRYSHGGQYFAAAVVNRIFIFNAYSFDPVGHLTGHSSMVKSFCWSDNDQLIVSAGFEGTIYEWRVGSCKRNESCEYSCKAMSYTAVCYDDVNQLAATVGSHKVAEGGFREGDVTLRVVKLTDAACAEPPLSTAHLGTAPQKYSHSRAQTREVAIAHHAGALFVGNAAGEVHVFAWPPQQVHALPQQVIEAHTGEVLFVVLTTDEHFLITVGSDGCLFMFDVDVLLEGRAPARRSFNYAVFDDVSIVLTNDLDERSRELSSLQSTLLDEQRARRHDKATTVQHFTQKLEEQMKASARMLGDATKERDDAVTGRRRTEEHMRCEFTSIEQQRVRDIQEVEAISSKRYKELAARCEALAEERSDLIVRYENKVFKMQKEHSEEKLRLEETSAAAVAALERELDRVGRDKRQGEDEASAVLLDTEEEHEQQTAAREKAMRQEFEAKEQELVRAQSEVDGCRRKQEKHDTHIKELERDLHEEQERVKRKEAKVADLEKSIVALRLEINVRNDTISASEKKILELKKQTAELEKLRYVLTFKFNELRKEVVPKEESIRAMSEKVERMDAELEKVGLDRDTMTQLLTAKEDKIGIIIKDMGCQNRVLDDKQRLLQMLLKDLSALLTDTEPRKVAFSLRTLVDQYTVRACKKGELLQAQSTVDFERQRLYMEAQLSASRRQNLRREGNMKIDGQRKTEENAQLVQEINELRHEKKLLGQKVQVLDTLQKDGRAVRPSSIQAASCSQRTRSAAQPLAGGGGGGGEPRMGGSRAPDQSGRCLSPLGATLSPGANSDAPSPHSAKGKGNSLGRIQRGTTLSMRELATMDPLKVASLVQQVELSQSEMEKQQAEILRLRDFVQHLLKKVQTLETRCAAPADTGRTSILPPPQKQNVIQSI